MKTLFLPLLALLLGWSGTTQAADIRCFELRTYYAAPDKLDALNARFRQHTLKLFEKHGIQNIGYWMPMENPERKLAYVVAFPSREARQQAWKSFGADPAWQAVVKETEVNGKLVEKVDVQFLTATDYSPVVAPARAEPARAFELRIYTATPGKLANLNARFREHTVKLFEKHGIANIAYWTPAAGEKGADDTLIYLIAHRDRDAAKASFEAFGKDPEWVAARKASEEKAGGSLTVPGGVKSVFMVPTDYSPMR